MTEETLHKFSRSEIRQAEHEFKEMLVNYFHEIYVPINDAQWRGKSWDCLSMIAINAGLWRLCQEVIHAGAKRVFGKIEVRDTGHMLRFIIFYEPVKEEPRIIQ